MFRIYNFIFVLISSSFHIFHLWAKRMTYSVIHLGRSIHFALVFTNRLNRTGANAHFKSKCWKQITESGLNQNVPSLESCHITNSQFIFLKQELRQMKSGKELLYILNYSPTLRINSEDATRILECKSLRSKIQ